MLGQSRAVEAIEFGTGIQVEGFNLFVLGPPGTGRHSFLRQFLGAKAATEPTPSDWCYVNNFDEARQPRVLEFPAGRGRMFRDDIDRLVREARTAIPAAFESEDYAARRQSIEQASKEEQQEALEAVQQHAEEAGLGIVQAATGFHFVPLRDGEAMAPEEYETLPDDERVRLERDTEKIRTQLRKMLQEIPRRVRKVRGEIQKLDREVALFAVGSLIEEVAHEYEDLPSVVEFLTAMQHDIAGNVELFTRGGSPDSSESLGQLLGGGQPQDGQSVLRRYGVNLIVDHSGSEGAPVVFEDHPTYPSLVGRIEHVSSFGALLTDFHLIRAGALHRANGGYLLIDARKILVQPFAWEALKRALKAREIDVRSLAQEYSLVSTVSLEPERIPLDVKVVIVGDRLFYYLLQAYDPEFSELFKVAADFEDQMARSDENVRSLAQLIGTIATREELMPFDRGAVARVVEESARYAGDAEMLSAQIRRLADVMREAHYWAQQNGNDVIDAGDVQRAIDARTRRASRLRDRLQREVLRGTIRIETDGEVVGQVNGLSVIQLGEEMFGRPTRISARIALGSGEVIDIEREVKLGGPIHSKGVLILSSFLASRYSAEQPLSLSASLVFEQSYGPVEGDSASAGELCALLSALADVPIKQSLAITGSVDQHGRIQAIGGVNEKVEGFFDICRERGLTGDQGVLIPASNVKHLMLRRDVVEAVEAGQFQLYALETIDECMGLLTGIEAGIADAEGRFPEETLNRRIADRLISLADARRAFAAKEGPEAED
jgi:lon-related putative ATP-dependent protease